MCVCVCVCVRARVYVYVSVYVYRQEFISLVKPDEEYICHYGCTTLINQFPVDLPDVRLVNW